MGERLVGRVDGAGGLSGVIAVAAGEYQSLALKQDGTVVAWGDNSYGQATVAGGLSGVIAIASGAWHGLALKQDGTVVAWGSNVDDQRELLRPVDRAHRFERGDCYRSGRMAQPCAQAGRNGSRVGKNLYGQAAAPSGLGAVVAIAAGGYQAWRSRLTGRSLRGAQAGRDNQGVGIMAN